METVNILKRVLKPPVLAWLGCIAYSIVFVTGYVGIGYQNYLKDHKTIQLQEIKTIYKKADLAFRQLNDLIDLTASLISTTFSTRTNLEHEIRIQEILKSASSLKPSSNLSSIQKIVFYKLSPPQLLISRFNILPLASADISLQGLKLQQPKSEFVLQEKTIVGRMIVRDMKSRRGILEIQLALSEFIQFLGAYQTIQLKEPPKSTLSIDKNRFPFLLAKNNPLPFQNYAYSLIVHNWMFIVYLSACLLILGVSLHICYRYINKTLFNTINRLEEDVLTLQTTETALNARVSNQQKDLEAFIISQQADKKFNHILSEKQKNQAKKLSKFFEVIKGDCSNLSDEAINIQMERSIKQATALSNGLWVPSNVDNVELNEVVKNFSMLFAEKLHQSNIHIEMQDLSGLPSFKGDALLIDVLLINILGKVLYRVPDQGTVIISAKEMPGYMHLQIQDTGFGRVIQAEKIIQKSFGLFMDEQHFKKLCKENGVYIKYSKTNQGHNITQILIPAFKSPGEGEKNNVVQLFS